MISTQNPFKSNLTDKIDQFIKMTKPTHDSPINAWQVAKVVLNQQDIDYKAVAPVKSYLNQLASKNLLRAYGQDSAIDVQPRQYWIHEPHQLSYWSR